MSSRRRFLKGAGFVGIGVALAPAIRWRAAATTSTEEASSPFYLTGRRMAATPATDYRAYRSKPVIDPACETWIQIDLGRLRKIDAIELYPASERMYPGLDKYYAGEGFPLRFHIEIAKNPQFRDMHIVAELSEEDFPEVNDNITQFSAPGVEARYVRLTATLLRPTKQPFKDPTPTGAVPSDSPLFTMTLAKIGVLFQGEDIAVDCEVSGDSLYGNRTELRQLTRPARQDGEEIRWDNVHHVTEPGSWKKPKMQASTPREGVILGDGLFLRAMQNNIAYLLSSYSTEDLLRQFDERAERVHGYKARALASFWEEDLAGSNAGRFLMGAGNTVRWIRHAELERRLTAVVDGIDACKQPDGYMMAYPANTIFYSERAAYTRAWVTHGLLEAAYSGNAKAFPLLRGYYDWFNSQKELLPELLRGAVQGGQGMVANTRVGLSPIGTPADIQVIQRYFEEPAFLRGLAAKDERQIWQYPYDRPHCYLLTNLEAYLDLYLATGNTRYYEAVRGAWELYRINWQQPGGSISIIEFQCDPPRSNYLHQELGELCGSSFWIFLNQRLHHLYPEDERFMAEIEKSIYNVVLANQDGAYGLRYHTHLEGQKETATRINTCCEGQGTRVLGSLPEHIYSIADDGVYVNLFAPSTLTWRQGNGVLSLTQNTSFPYANDVLCQLTAAASTRATLRLRVPSWLLKTVEFKVNGDIVGAGQPGSYFAIDRVWSTGDIIGFHLPAEFRATAYTGADQPSGRKQYSLEYGPLLYAAVGKSRVELNGLKNSEALIGQLRKRQQPLEYALDGHPEIAFKPYWIVGSEEFTCFPLLQG